MSRGGYGTVREYRDDPSLDYRDDASSNRNSARSPNQGNNFATVTDQITENIFKISSNISQLERQVKDIGTSRDNTALRNHIHDQEQKTNKLVAATTQLFKSSARIRAPSRQSTIQIERLKSDFEGVIQRYNRLQKLVANKVKTAPPLQTTTLVDIEDDRAELFANEQRRELLQAQDLVVEQDVAMIEEREEQIRQLEGDIININDIFRDLAALVYEQGDMIDSIEANVEKGYDNVDQGNRQLEQASQYATKYRKKLCFCGIILAVVVFIIAIILIVELKK